MSKINSGILHNAEPLTEEQLNVLRKQVLENGEAFACINADKELCFLMPTDPKVIKELAWDRAEELCTNDLNRVELALYRKSDTNAFFLEQYLQSSEDTTSPSWSFVAVPRQRFSWDYNGDDTVSITGNTYEPPSRLYIPAQVPTGPTTNATVTTIAAGAFRNSDTLTYVNIPPTVTGIESYAFYECPNLTEIDLGNYEGSLPESVGGNCQSFSTFSVGAANKKYSTVDGLLLNAEKTALVRCPSGRAECSCPNGVQEIMTSAFAYGKLSAVTIPKSVTSIASYAFSYTPSSLTTITYEGSWQLWKNITKGNYWHGYASSIEYVQCSDGLFTLAGELVSDPDPEQDGLTYNINSSGQALITGYTENLPADVVIPDTISGYPVIAIDSGAFMRNRNITSVSIPNTVTSIGVSAFSGCSSLATVSLGDGVIRLENSAFRDCTSLERIQLPNSVSYIHEYAFEGCSSLQGFYVSGLNAAFSAQYGVLFDKNKTVLIKYPAGRTTTSFTVPNTVTNIATMAFSNANYLTTVTIPTSVTTIMTGAFVGCSNLTTVRYQGTTFGWSQVTKEQNWAHQVCFSTVTCANGSVSV